MRFQNIFRCACLVFADIALPFSLSAQTNPSETEISAFLAADDDQTQTLTLDEFKVFIRLMARHGQPTARTIRFWGAYRYAFNLADINNDGALDPDELASGNHRHMSGE